MVGGDIGYLFSDVFGLFTGCVTAAIPRFNRCSIRNLDTTSLGNASMRVIVLSLTLCDGIASAYPLNHDAATSNYAADVRTYKVTLTKSSESTNREAFIQARDSGEARRIAKDQNPGWDVLLVTEVK